METLIKIAGVCVLCAAAGLLMRRHRPELAFCLSAACCAAAFAAALPAAEPVLAFVRELQSLTGLETPLLAPLFKTVALGLLTQISAAFCHDAGEGALCKTVELCGTLLALYAALPLAQAVLQTAKTLMGG